MPTAARTTSHAAFDWIALAAHALSHRWPHVPPSQLEEVAAELYCADAFRSLAPADAVALWLLPLAVGPAVRETLTARIAA